IDNCLIKEIEGVEETIWGVVGKIKQDIRYFETLPGVAKVIPISKPYKLVSRELKPNPTRIKIRDVEIGGNRLVVIAGPCAVETRQRTLEIGRIVRRHGAVLFRAGAFKPRTSPYSFQGLEEEGLKILAELREETGMGVVTEMTSPHQADLFVKYVDVVQIGARNMQNFELLKCVGRLGLPVLLKRGLSAVIEEWLMAAEYILSEGNDKVILCERGIRTFETYTRNTLDLTAVPIIKTLSHLPIIVDPSHATGIRDKVIPMGRAAVAAGADGLIVEVHSEPDKAFSDGPQSLYPHQFEQLMRDLYVIAPVVGKYLDLNYLDKAVQMKSIHTTHNGPLKVAYHAMPGSSCHKALINFFGTEVPAESRRSFREVFEAVAKGEASMGLIPLENTLSGSNHENYDLLLEYDFKIIAELTLRIVHNLIGIGNSDLTGLKRIYSHPVVFEQCKEFLAGHPEWDLVAVSDTASSVKRVKDDNNPEEAAIASLEASELYNLPVLKEGVETNPRNFTRYAIIAQDDAFIRSAKNKSSLIYSVEDAPGALFETLKVFAENAINIVKLESRPAPGSPWEYLFYVDVNLDITDEKNSNILAMLREKTKFFKVLGAYSSGSDIKGVCN
ncbi:MAG: 3-deoxy-7-phosphoheptulonate synthase, partial [Deltaproteobacteria bacterium]|nr:3-deoxy-7-phosphoheptulonate synthase [Deltaproteobacteria bacterium]